MKRIYFLAISATLLAASCQKTEVINPTCGPSLSFTTGMSKLTKAQGTVDAENKGLRNLEAQDFSVWAYADPQSDFSTSTVVDSETRIYDKIINLLVECKTASVDAVLDNPETSEVDESKDAMPGVWNTEKEYFWPGEGKDLRFFAVSADASWLRPTEKGATCPVSIDYNAPSLTISGFEVKSTPVVDNSDPDNPVIKKTAANEDLMVADFVKQNQSKKDVDLKFRHTLSKVEFVFKTIAAEEGETVPTVYVQSLNVDKLQYKGDLDVTTKDASATPVVWDFKWKLDEATTMFNDDWTNTVTFPTTVEAAAAADNTAMKLTPDAQTFTTWLVMPQTISNKELSITYIINNRQFTSVFPIDGEKDELPTWACNQHIKYTITLAPNVISFKPTVEDWTPYDADNTKEGN